MNRGLRAEPLVFPVAVTEVDAVVGANTSRLSHGGARDQGHETEEKCDRKTVAHRSLRAHRPNGSRLSCGRLARRRKVIGRSVRARQGTTLRFL